MQSSVINYEKAISLCVEEQHEKDNVTDNSEAQM